MKPAKFIDNRFQELRIQEQKEDQRKEYSVTRDGEVLALHALLKTLRTLVKWAMIPKVIVQYLLVSAGLMVEPQPVLINLLKENQAKEKKELEKKAQKLGMASMASLTERLEPKGPSADGQPLPN